MENLLSRNNIMMVAVLAILYMVWMAQPKKPVATTPAV